MNIEKNKKEIFFQKRDIDTSVEYSIDKLQELANEFIESFKRDYKNLPFELSLSTWKVQAEMEYGYYGDSDHAKFEMIFYRWEDDKEYHDRLVKEFEKAKRDKENKIKSQAKAKQLAKEKAEKQAELEANPDYKKFLELKKIFKNG